MKKQSWLAVIALLFLYAIPSTAQCGLYTYQDFWIDDNGNAVGDNYTEATCYRTSAYADVQVTMPSGYQNGASASGTTSAEAVTQSSTSGEAGDGLFSGYNEAASACWENYNDFSFSGIFSLGVSFAWYQFNGAIFNLMQPCPEPGHTISCASPYLVISVQDIEGDFAERRRSFVRIFGGTLCSPLSFQQQWQNTPPQRPYCYDLP